MRRRLSLRLTGTVQGVNLRHSVRLWAMQQHIGGFVRNEPDGSVTVELEGEREKLQQAYDWLCTSPGASRVASCQVRWLEPLGLGDSFNVS